MDGNSLLPDDTIIWRYMNLEGFISLIANQSLSFCRLDVFRSIDPYEGSNSKKELEQQDFVFRILSMMGKANDNNFLNGTEFMQNVYRNYLEERNKQFFINCWHINSIESVAMWDTFTNSKTGVAIKTTLGNLRKSLKDEDKNKYDFKFDKVAYVDLKEYKGSIAPLLRKTRYFEHEKELRVHFSYIKEWVIEGSSELEINEKKSGGAFYRIKNPDRIDITVDTSQLINEVVVSPKSEDWFLGLITKLLESYHLDIIPRQSEIQTNNVQINSGEYDLINIEDEFKNFMKNSWLGQAAKEATYRLNYDETSGKIKGCYPTNVEYNKVPEPYINLSWEEWNKFYNNQSSAKVDLISKKVIFDK